MSNDPLSYGELLPLGGGDPIPLFKRSLLIGRRESCDIVLRFANVSAHHCQLTLTSGYWYVKDMQSRNGVKVNGTRVSGDKRLDPGDQLSVAKHNYEINYTPNDVGAVGPPPVENLPNDIMSKSLLERAGLGGAAIRKIPVTPASNDQSDRYDLLNNAAGQLKKPNSRPV